MLSPLSEEWQFNTPPTFSRSGVATPGIDAKGESFGYPSQPWLAPCCGGEPDSDEEMDPPTVTPSVAGRAVLWKGAPGLSAMEYCDRGRDLLLVLAGKNPPREGVLCVNQLDHLKARLESGGVAWAIHNAITKALQPHVELVLQGRPCPVDVLVLPELLRLGGQQPVLDSPHISAVCSNLQTALEGSVGQSREEVMELLADAVDRLFPTAELAPLAAVRPSPAATPSAAVRQQPLPDLFREDAAADAAPPAAAAAVPAAAAGQARAPPPPGWIRQGDFFLGPPPDRRVKRLHDLVLECYWVTLLAHFGGATGLELERLRKESMLAHETITQWGTRLGTHADRYNASTVGRLHLAPIPPHEVVAILLRGLKASATYSSVAGEGQRYVDTLPPEEHQVLEVTYYLQQLWDNRARYAAAVGVLDAVAGSAVPAGARRRDVAFSGMPPAALSSRAVEEHFRALPGGQRRRLLRNLQLDLEEQHPDQQRYQGAGGRRYPVGAAASWDQQQPPRLEWYPVGAAGYAGGRAGAAAAQRAQPGRSPPAPPGNAFQAGHHQGPPGFRPRPCECVNPNHPPGDVCYIANPQLAGPGFHAPPRGRPDRLRWEQRCREEGLPVPAGPPGLSSSQSQQDWRARQPPAGGSAAPRQEEQDWRARPQPGAGRDLPIGSCRLVSEEEVTASFAVGAATRGGLRRDRAAAELDQPDHHQQQQHEPQAARGAPGAVERTYQPGATLQVDVLLPRDNDLLDAYVRRETGKEPVQLSRAGEGDVHQVSLVSFGRASGESRRVCVQQDMLAGRVPGTLALHLPRDFDLLSSLISRTTRLAQQAAPALPHAVAACCGVAALTPVAAVDASSEAPSISSHTASTLMQAWAGNQGGLVYFANSSWQEGLGVVTPDGRGFLPTKALFDTGAAVPLMDAAYGRALGLQEVPVPARTRLSFVAGPGHQVTHMFKGVTLVLKRGTEQETQVVVDFMSVPGLEHLAEVMVPTSVDHAFGGAGVDRVRQEYRFRPGREKTLDAIASVPVRSWRPRDALDPEVTLLAATAELPEQVHFCGCAVAAAQELEEHQQMPLAAAAVAAQELEEHQQMLLAAAAAAAQELEEQQQMPLAAAAAAAQELEEQQQVPLAAAGAAALAQEQEEQQQVPPAPAAALPQPLHHVLPDTMWAAAAHELACSLESEYGGFMYQGKLILTREELHAAARASVSGNPLRDTQLESVYGQCPGGAWEETPMQHRLRWAHYSACQELLQQDNALRALWVAGPRGADRPTFHELATAATARCSELPVLRLTGPPMDPCTRAWMPERVGHAVVEFVSGWGLIGHLAGEGYFGPGRALQLLGNASAWTRRGLGLLQLDPGRFSKMRWGLQELPPSVAAWLVRWTESLACNLGMEEQEEGAELAVVDLPSVLARLHVFWELFAAPDAVAVDLATTLGIQEEELLSVRHRLPHMLAVMVAVATQALQVLLVDTTWSSTGCQGVDQRLVAHLSRSRQQLWAAAEMCVVWFQCNLDVHTEEEQQWQSLLWASEELRDVTPAEEARRRQDTQLDSTPLMAQRISARPGYRSLLRSLILLFLLCLLPFSAVAAPYQVGA